MEPFDVTLKRPDGGAIHLRCIRILRVIAGRRTVFDGVYGGEAVIAKRFEDILGRYRCGRERRGLERLRECGLRAPKVFFSGKDPAGHHVLVIEKIDNAVDVLSAVESAVSAEAARTILLSVFAYVAQMHQAGVVQYDLHLGNFLVADSAIYVIDPAWMRFRTQPIGKAESRRQLAVLVAALPKAYANEKAAFLQAYCDQRGWHYSDDLLGGISRLAVRHRMKALPHALKKTLRNSKLFAVLQQSDCRIVYSKEAFTAEAVVQLVDQIETLSENADGIFDWHGRRYRIEGYASAYRVGGFVSSPARRAWRAAWRAIYTGQEVPRPAALIESRAGLLAGRSWFISVAAAADEPS